MDRVQHAATPGEREPKAEEIERLAYELWEARGSPYGSSELDWIRAEEILRARYSARESASRDEVQAAVTEREPANVDNHVAVGNHSARRSHPVLVVVGVAALTAALVIAIVNRVCR